MGLPGCSLYTGMRRSLSHCMILSVFLAQWSRCMSPFVCCTTVLSRSKLLGAKASARHPRLVIHLSSETTASLAWWVSSAGFAANASVPVGELDRTIKIWTDASLEHEGHRFHGDFAKRSWTSSDLTDDPSINLL